MKGRRRDVRTDRKDRHKERNRKEGNDGKAEGRMTDGRKERWIEQIEGCSNRDRRKDGQKMGRRDGKERCTNNRRMKGMTTGQMEGKMNERVEKRWVAGGKDTGKEGKVQTDGRTAARKAVWKAGRETK